MNKRCDDNRLYDDGRIVITRTDIRTPRIYYPVHDTSGRVRRDALWFALSYIAICGAALGIYHDLFYRHELAAVGASMALALLIGLSVSTLQLDARGFPPITIYGTSWRIRKIFHAITHARAQFTILGGGGEMGGELSAETEEWV